MDRQRVLKQLDDERRNLAHEGEIIEVLPDVTRSQWTDPVQHLVLFSALTAQNADAVISREIAHYSQLNASFEWKHYSHDAPADLLQRLQAHGFEVGPCEAVMVFDLLDRPDWIADGIDTLQVQTLEQLQVYRRVAEGIFGAHAAFTCDALEASFRAGSPQNLGYIVFAGSEPVSVGRLCTHPRSAFAGLYSGGTLPGHRGHGHYRALIAARARDALKMGAKYLLVDALPTSRPILERLGFQCVSETRPCEWHPGTASA